MHKYVIHLSKEELETLPSIINKESYSSYAFRVAYVLLHCDEGEYSDKTTNEQMAWKGCLSVNLLAGFMIKR